MSVGQEMIIILAFRCKETQLKEKKRESDIQQQRDGKIENQETRTIKRQQELENVQRVTVHRAKEGKLNCQVCIIMYTTLKSIFKWCY